MPSVSRSRLAIHERHFSNGVWIYLGIGKKVAKEERAEGSRLSVWNTGNVVIEKLGKLGCALRKRYRSGLVFTQSRVALL